MLKLHWALINRGHLITWGFGAGVLSHAFPGSSESKEFAWNAGDLGSIPELERSPEKEMATHSSTLASKSPWMEEPGGLYSPWDRKESHTTEPLHFSVISKASPRTRMSWRLSSRRRVGSHRCYSFCCWVRFDLSQGIHFFEVVENRTEKFLRKEKEISTDISCHHDVLPIFSLNVLPRSNLQTILVLRVHECCWGNLFSKRFIFYSYL